MYLKAVAHPPVSGDAVVVKAALVELVLPVAHDDVPQCSQETVLNLIPVHEEFPLCDNPGWDRRHPLVPGLIKGEEHRVLEILQLSLADLFQSWFHE